MSFNVGTIFCSIRNSLDLIQRDGVVAAIVEAGGPRGAMASHLLGDFEFAAVL
jgi:hypothetical protein